MSKARWRPHSSMRQQERQDRRDEMAGVPDAAARRDPQDLRREPEQDRRARGDRDRRATPIRPSSHQHSPTPARREQRVDPGLPLVGGHRADERDERHEDDRRERGERHVEVAVDDDDVVRPELERRARSGRAGTRRRGRRSRRGPPRTRGPRASRRRPRRRPARGRCRRPGRTGASCGGFARDGRAPRRPARRQASPRTRSG